MKLNIDDIRRQYAELSDEALLDIDRDDLVDQARQCYDAELARRHLSPTPTPAPAEDFAVVATYPTPAEAELARSLLRDAIIPAHLSSDASVNGVIQLLVASGDLDAARDVLASHVPDAQLAAELTHIRHGVGAVRPYLYGTLDLLDFVEAVFHPVELERHEFSPTALHVELMIGDSVVVLELSDPLHPSATHASIYVYVEDVDAIYDLALESGAGSIAVPTDKPYRERAAGVQDSSGNIWWISTYLGE
ncbi:MAG: hypothetical protein JWP63_1845 [Candidatus Solibacter sp.]|jgi:PhnB protein|nr:hypothetical protein [Candidatus Solibacter sp.]